MGGEDPDAYAHLQGTRGSRAATAATTLAFTCLLSAPAVEARKVGDGVLLVVETDPEKWDTPQALARNETVLDHLGREHFYDKHNPAQEFKAPTYSRRTCGG